MLGFTIVDYLESDARPTFVVTVKTSATSESETITAASATPSSDETRPHAASPPENCQGPLVEYINPALTEASELLKNILSISSNPKSKFWQWIISSPLRDSPPVVSWCSALGFVWTRTWVGNEWIVVSANKQEASDEPPRKIRVQKSGSERTTFSMGLEQSSCKPVETGADDHCAPSTELDRTSSPVTPRWVFPEFMPEQEPYLDVIRNVDWEATPLGAMDSWHPRLKQNFEQIVVDSRPIAIFWGPHHTVVYNQAYSKLVGLKHPGLLGRTVDEAWPEACARLKATMRLTSMKKRATIEDEMRCFVSRPDRVLEETYLKWAIIPITEGDTCFGFAHPITETTSTRLWERRMKMLIDLGEVLASSRNVESYWSKTMAQLESVNPTADIPVAILYSVEDDDDSQVLPQAEFNCHKTLHFQGSLGVPKGHDIVPSKLQLRSSREGLSSCFRRALESSHPILTRTRDGSLPDHLLDGLQWRAFGDPCRAAVICPIRPTKEESVMGILFLGLNPRRPYDTDYRQYISLLNQKLTTSLASTVLLEEETRRRRTVAEQAAYDQAILKRELASKEQEANESMQRFRAVAEFVPIGMCFGDTNNISYANDAWYRITGHPRTRIEHASFLKCVVEEDQSNIAKAYAQLMVDDTVEFHFRVRPGDSLTSSPCLRPPAIEASGFNYYGLEECRERFVSAAAKVESRGADGSIVILTCLTDITVHKKNADEAVRRAQQAENLKRMAERSTSGMYDIDLEGRLISANNVFYEMCGIDRSLPGQRNIKPWDVAVEPDDMHLIQGCFSRLVEHGTPQYTEIRLRTSSFIQDGSGRKVAGPRWVNATLMPIKSKSGIIESCTGCFSDVSLQKWQLQQECAHKEAALESKRLQESFIDMTSHEMRNPLSAMIHCADAIITALSQLRKRTISGGGSAVEFGRPSAEDAQDQAKVESLVADCIDNGETIISCAQHQKSIVDDILTMSKLDSKLLAVAPFTVDPERIVQEALKMFAVEARRVDINLSMAVDTSYYEQGLKYLDLDPSRMKQVLINLLTNALKFTKTETTRNVSVTISASDSRPTNESCGVEFLPPLIAPGEGQPQPAVDGRGPPVYLIFEVRDTGQGLTEKEMSNLFKRFSQGSIKTHVKYGGSGLGLYISRSLAELQRGAIGVSSRPGVGSTFTFFIEAYRPSPKELAEVTLNEQITLAPEQAKPVLNAGAAGRGARRSVHPPGLIDGVLIVEDNVVNQRVTKKGLECMGITVNVANHGEEALEKLRLSKWICSGHDAVTKSADCRDNASNSSTCVSGDTPDKVMPLSVILMDIEMPVMDGLTCTRQIRKMESEGLIKARVPIIAVSANARTEQILEARKAGCDDVVVKPYFMADLYDRMVLVDRKMNKSR